PIGGFRGFFIVVWPSKFLDVLRLVRADVCLTATIAATARRKPIVLTPTSQAETCRITYRCACSVIRHFSSRNDFNPYLRPFSIPGPGPPQTAGGFLQVSLSKIRGNISPLQPPHPLPRISDQR